MFEVDQMGNLSEDDARLLAAVLTEHVPEGEPRDEWTRRLEKGYTCMALSHWIPGGDPMVVVGIYPGDTSKFENVLKMKGECMFMTVSPEKAAELLEVH